MNKQKIDLCPKNFLKKVNVKKISNSKNLRIPLISVVMPSFNKVRYIEKSILSVLNQSYQNIELIIIDGGSEDGTLDVIKKYDQFIHYWVSEKDNGQSDALNKGFKKANGEILCWMNTDDLFLPGALATASQTLTRNPKKKICYGDWVSIDEDDKIIDKHFALDFDSNHLKYEGFLFNAQSLFWTQEVHKSFSGFDTSLNKTMDYQMMIEFGTNQTKHSFIRIEKTLAAFRRYADQKTGIYGNEEHKEHQYLSIKYQYEDKYKFKGKLKRFFFRFRRVIWYFKRGGIKELKKRILNWNIL
jgi:glycosyltransferase involved in cell wall biosynthesis